MWKTGENIKKEKIRGNGGIEVKTHIWNLSGPIQVNRGNGISRKRKSHKRRRECIITSML